MTVVVGLLYDSGVVLSSDSKVSGYQKDEIARKLHRAVFGDGGCAVVGGAGFPPHIDLAVASFRHACTKHETLQRKTVATIAENAINAVKKRYKEPSVSLVVGTRCSGYLGLYSVEYHDTVGCAVGSKRASYVSIGSGSAVADYILKCLWREEMTQQEATRLAVYAVDAAIQTIDSCDYPIQVSVITDAENAKPITFSASAVDQVSGQMRAELGQARKHQLAAVFGA